jgi:hypothetical protein
MKKPWNRSMERDPAPRQYDRWAEEDVHRLEYLLFDLGLAIDAIAILLQRRPKGIRLKLRLLGWDQIAISPERLRRGHEAFQQIQKSKAQKAAEATLAEELRQGRAELRNGTPVFKCGPNGERLDGREDSFW